MNLLRLGTTLALILALSSACNFERSPDAAYPGNSDDITMYEGDVAFDSAQYVHLRIELISNNGTQGTFSLTEDVIRDGVIVGHSVKDGSYNLEADSNRTLLSLENSMRPSPLRRRFITATGRIREQNFRHTDLVFQMMADHLILLENGERISDDPRYFLYARMSPEFTVEGYLMYRGDTSLFHEANTGINWPLAKLGAYDQAALEHNTLADKKNDTTYLKGTGYAIRLLRGEKRIDALVLKTILQSSSY